MITKLAKFEATQSRTPIKVLIVDWENLSRQGLKILIEQEAEMKVVAEAQNGRSAVMLAKKIQPDVVVMGVDLPELNGIDATKQILTESPASKVVALANSCRKHTIKGMIQAGASAFLVKDCFFEELSYAIHSVVRNRQYLSEKIAGIVMHEFAVQMTTPEEEQSTGLTSREREVLQLIAEGVKTKDIAERLYVSTKTIEAHRRQIMEKLKVNSIAALTKYAIREGLTSL